jgi:hypothetical protein
MNQKIRCLFWNEVLAEDLLFFISHRNNFGLSLILLKIIKTFYHDH